MAVFFSILIGYLIGSVNPAYLLARLRGFDIRKRGSGNAGASNAVITMGKTQGILSAVFDVLKACAAVWLASYFLPDFRFASELAGTFCVIGHVFPFYMGFEGGKGLACLGGVVLSYNWVLFLVLLAIEAVLALAVDYICIVPITGCVVFPVIYAVITRSLVGSAIYLTVTAVMLFKHVENLRRIKNGTELHLSFLWNKDRELERISDRTEV